MKKQTINKNSKERELERKILKAYATYASNGLLKLIDMMCKDQEVDTDFGKCNRAVFNCTKDRLKLQFKHILFERELNL